MEKAKAEHWFWTWDDQDRLTFGEEKTQGTWSAEVRINSINIVVHYVYQKSYNHIWRPRKSAMCASFFYSLPLLKSNLQKAVRRKLTQAALATTKHMLVQDASVLLRRLAIITVEDVRVVEDLDKVVWLMGAVSKNFTMQKVHLLGILGFVRSLCEEPVFDRVSLQVPNFVPKHGLIEAWNRHWARKDSLCVALWIRMAYGGRKGDMKMFFATLEKVYHGSLEIGPAAWTNFPRKLSEVPDFKACHMLNEAADFHCTPIAVEASRRFRISVPDLRSWIWNERSGVNARVKKRKRTYGERLESEEENLHEWMNQEAPRFWCTDLTLPKKKKVQNRLITEFMH